MATIMVSWGLNSDLHDGKLLYSILQVIYVILDHFLQWLRNSHCSSATTLMGERFLYNFNIISLQKTKPRGLAILLALPGSPSPADQTTVTLIVTANQHQSLKCKQLKLFRGIHIIELI